MMDMYVAQNPDLASRIIDDEAVILTPDNGMLHNLNPVGTRIFALANGRTKLKDIIQAIMDEYGAEEGAAHRDTVNFIEDLMHKKILVLSDSPVKVLKK